MFWLRVTRAGDCGRVLWTGVCFGKTSGMLLRFERLEEKGLPT